jgi:hypothetical protein
MDEPVTLPFETFWTWLTSHPDCILRAGTPETILYDDEDLHWIFAAEGPGTLLVQVLRGKRPMGEMFLEPEPIAYVQGGASEREGEFVFELVAETESDRIVTHFFVMVHGYEPQEEGPHGPPRVH